MFTAKTNFNHYVQYVKQQGHELVTTGVYSFCRHPSYVGWFLWSIGTQVGNERNIYELHHEKNQQCGFRTSLTKSKLYKHRRWLEALNFGFRMKRNCTISVTKIKALVSHMQIFGFLMRRPIHELCHNHF